MKKIGLLLMLTVGLVRAEVLCVFDQQAWDSATVSSVRSTLSYTGSTWTGLMSAADALSITSYDALNDSYASLPFDINYAIYFAADATECTHTIALAGGATSGLSPVSSSNMVSNRTRAQSSLVRLINNNEITTKEDEEEEKKEAPKLSFSVGLGTYSNDDVSIFDSNVIPIFVYYGDLMFTYINAEEANTIGIGYSAINDNSIKEWSLSYSSFDYLNVYSFLLHASTLYPDESFGDLSFTADFIIAPEEVDSWKGLDYDLNALIFNPIADNLYFELGLALGLNMYDTAQTLRYGVLTGVLFVTDILTYSADIGYYKSSYNYDFTDANSEWVSRDGSAMMNFAVNYNY